MNKDSCICIPGISTGMLSNKQDFDALLEARPSAIEFYNYPSSSLPSIKAFCKAHKLRSGLHVPTPYDGSKPLRYFSPTGPGDDEVSLAIRLTLDTLQCAFDIGAGYIVVHFPSPYPVEPETLTLEHIRRFFDPIYARSLELGVRICVENMSSHPTFYRPSDYKQIFELYPQLRLCLDFSHAHLLSPVTSLEQFIAELGEHIGSCHVNNVSLLRYGRFRSEMISPEQKRADGFADIEGAIGAILQKLKSPPVYLIAEANDDMGLQDTRAKFSWLKEIVSRIERSGASYSA